MSAAIYRETEIQGEELELIQTLGTKWGALKVIRSAAIRPVAASTKLIQAGRWISLPSMQLIQPR